jgi:hypothetical protein
MSDVKLHDTRRVIMPNNKRIKTVVVAGDVTMDWNIATTLGTRGAISYWSQGIYSSIFWQRGGAAQLADMIEAISKKPPADRQYVVRQMDMPRKEVFPSDKRYHHSYTMWTPFKYSEKAPHEKPAWRVEHFLGIDRSTEDAGLAMKVIDDDPSAELVVLDDASRQEKTRLGCTEDGSTGCPWTVMGPLGKRFFRKVDRHHNGK